MGRIPEGPLLAKLLESVVDNVYVFDRELRYAFVSPTGASALGLQPDDVIGRTWRELGLPATVMEPVEQQVRTVFARGQIFREETLFDGPHGPKYYEYIVTPVCEPGGEVELVTTIGRDITDRKQAELALASAHEFEKRIVAIVGHDIRSPLSAIDLSVHGLLRGGELSAAGVRTAERIARSVDRIRHIVDDLLDFTRARHGGIPIEREQTDLQALCRQVFEELEARTLGRPLNFTCDGEATGWWDPHRIAQAVSNLVSNAIQHSPPETPIDVALHATHDAVTLAVKNQGHIPAEVLPRIFDPFRRGDLLGAEQGLGLGLFIAQTIARGHGGSIDVDSAPADGVTFRLRLPRQQAKSVLAPGSSGV